MAQAQSAVEIIKEAQKSEKLTIGMESTIKALKEGKLEYAFIASNAPASLVSDVQHNSEVFGTKFSQVSVKGDELGVACKKQFNVTIVGVLKK